MTHRPNKFDDIIGQSQVLKCLKIVVKSSQINNTTTPHILLDGPPGLGKTTIATAMANELNTPIQVANGANLRSLKVLIPFLTRIKENSILFIDEIHRITKIVEEFLYPAMEDFKITLGKEEDVVEIKLPRFTMIGATTNAGRLSTPLIDRFVYKYHLTRYKEEDLIDVIKRNAGLSNVVLDDDCCGVIAKSSRGTPRVVNNILQWCKDYVSVNQTSINKNNIYDIIAHIGIDKDGLDDNDRKYLSVLKSFKKPIGVKTIAHTSGIAQDTIENVIEPFLLERKIILKTEKGRVLSQCH